MSSSSSRRDKRIQEEMTGLLGSVCVNLLDEQYWNPSDSLVAIFDEFIPQLLREPNPEDPNNHDAAALLLASEEKFEQRVRGEETVVY
ncbi:hypothetical protein K1719_031643 [Acacia pycnantha]|nr:hypothetical protein K1719_031643 [Acacia pycnantha]